MAQKRKNDGELANTKKQKTKGKPNLILSAAAPAFSLMVTSNKFLMKLLGKKTPSIDLLDVDDRVSVHLPEEILVDVLSRLPVRSLVRFKCVSKFWTTLISDPYFIRKHLNRAKNDQHSQKLLINQFCTKEQIYSIYCCPLSPVQRIKDVQKLKLDCPSMPKPEDCIIHSCYDGLAVIQLCDRDRLTFVLWNPSTRESILLPALGCPKDTSSRFGLGYDSTSGVYKILHMHQNSKYPNEILAVKGSSWRRIDEHPLGNCIETYGMMNLPFICVAFHWIAVPRNYIVVVSFSISNEVYEEIPLPEEILSLSLGFDTVGLSVLGGMLSVHCNSIRMGKSTFKVWVLKEYGVKGSWMPLLNIVKDTCSFNGSPKYMFADGQVLFRCLSVKSRGHLFRTVNGPFQSWPRCDTFQGGLAFTESLISPKSLTY